MQPVPSTGNHATATKRGKTRVNQLLLLLLIGYVKSWFAPIGLAHHYYRASLSNDRWNTGHQDEYSTGVCTLQKVQQDLESKTHQQEDKRNALQDAGAFNASLRL